MVAPVFFRMRGVGEMAVDERFVPPTLAMVRRSIMALMAAGLTGEQARDRFLGHSRDHLVAYQRAMQEFAEIPRVVVAQWPRRAGDKPVYMRTGGAHGSEGRTRPPLLEHFPPSLHGPAPTTI